ncbi:unnamed protein product, partial [Tetraodon nigroviridis]
QYASWDEVNVVAHGLLQLGQGLKEHVDKTKAQTRDINTRLKLLDATVVEVERRWREQEEALRARSSQKVLAAQNSRIDPLVEKMEQQEDKLDKQSLRLQRLESKVASTLPRQVSHRRAQRRRDGKPREEEPRSAGGATPAPTLTSRPLGQRSGGHVCALLSGRARDCQHLYAAGQRASGVYTIQPDGSHPLDVFCDMTSEGGWTVIQRRHDGSQNFNQPWERYKRGFGSLSGEKTLQNLQNLQNRSSASRSNTSPADFPPQASSGWAWRRSAPSPNKVPTSCGWSSAMGQDSSSRWPGTGSTWTGRTRSSPSAWRTRPPPLPPPRAAPESPFPRRTETTTWPWMSTARSCFQVGLRPPSAPERRDGGTQTSLLVAGGWWFSSCGDWNLNGRRPSAPSREQPRKPEAFRTSQGRRRSVKTTLLKIAPT